MMQPNQTRTIRLADSQIQEISMTAERVVLRLKSWDGHPAEVVIEDLAGCEVYAALKVDLSRIQESNDDPFITKACTLADEPPDGYHCYLLYAGWSDDPVARFVAKEVHKR
jgi:hypothetical protein